MMTTELNETGIAQTAMDRLIHAGIGLLFGILLYIDLLPGDKDPGYIVLSIALGLVGCGVALLLTFRREQALQVAALGGGLGLLLGLMAFFTLRLFAEHPFDDGLPDVTVFISSCVIGYIVVAFVQTRLETEDRSFPYESLFIHAWSNILLVGVALAFTLAAWLVLALWMGLFGLVEIDLFGDIFTSSPFIYLFTGLIFGLSMALAKEYDRLILALRNLALILCLFLAPVLALAAILFLSVLPFTGLDPLWDTGAATPILLILMLASVLAVNAVVQYGQEKVGLPAVARYLVMLELALLPVFAVLAFYSTWLRVEQYGLMPERIYALLIIAIAALHAVAYSAAVILGRGNWRRGIIRANPALAVVTALLLVLVHAPGITPYDLSARDQYTRLTSGEAQASDFDFGALKFKLGVPGREALARIEEREDVADRDIVEAQLAVLDGMTNYYDWQLRGLQSRELSEELRDFASYMTLVPPGLTLPDEVFDLMSTNLYELETCRNTDETDCAIAAIDADGDGADEYAFFSVTGTYGYGALLYQEPVGGPWMRLPLGDHDFAGAEGRDAFFQALARGDISLAKPRFQDIRIGNLQFSSKQMDRMRNVGVRFRSSQPIRMEPER